VDDDSKRALIDRLKAFTIDDAHQVKEREKVTNHDVKAVEYQVKAWMEEVGLNDYAEFIHFGLTSQDINNTATPWMLKDGLNNVLMPLLDRLSALLRSQAEQWVEVPMLARTHGQPASPTRLGKEWRVFIERLDIQKKRIEEIPFSAKFGGATGNFNAHMVSYPEIDWPTFANGFVDSLGLQRSQTTTQIEHYDNMAALFQGLSRVHTILIDLCRDIWTYISMDYFKQKVVAGEVGSSAMPHKVNPIDFENAEGNLGLANALCRHLAADLPISRLQRDLTDSTVSRNIGLPFAYSVIAMKSMIKGLDKLQLNRSKLADDLEANWAVVAEAIQNVLRRTGYPKPYEALKSLTRGNHRIEEEDIMRFIESLEVEEGIKSELKRIRPENYLGYP
jgi:adenylosuccinate lyase